MNRFNGHSHVVTTNNYNTLKITVIITQKIKSSTSAYYSLLGNESYLVNSSTIELSYEKLSDCLERRLKSLHGSLHRLAHIHGNSIVTNPLLRKRAY
jgi:hypothetical protein